MSQILILKGFSLKEEEAAWWIFIFRCIECRGKLHHPLHPFCPRGIAVIPSQKTACSIRPLFPPVVPRRRLRLRSDGKVPSRLGGEVGVLMPRMAWHHYAGYFISLPEVKRSSSSCIGHNIQCWEDKKSEAALLPISVDNLLNLKGKIWSSELEHEVDDSSLLDVKTKIYSVMLGFVTAIKFAKQKEVLTLKSVDMIFKEILFILN